MLRSVCWYLVADVLEQNIGTIFIVEVCPETSVTTNLRCVTSQKSEDLNCDSHLSCHMNIQTVTGFITRLPRNGSFHNTQILISLFLFQGEW